MQRFVVLIAMVGVLATGVLLYRAPWERVHPNDSSLSLGSYRAPVWQHPIATETSKASLNGPETILEVGIVWLFVVACGMLVRFSVRQDRSNRNS